MPVWNVNESVVKLMVSVTICDTGLIIKIFQTMTTTINAKNLNKILKY